MRFNVALVAVIILLVSAGPASTEESDCAIPVATGDTAAVKTLKARPANPRTTRRASVKPWSREARSALEIPVTRIDVAAIGPKKGPENAPVTIVVFSDFQCPFCARLVPTLEQVRAKYGDKVRIVFRNYPLPLHPNAQKAAEAGLCAHEQGKFWELHDAMFANQQELAVEHLKAKAAELGLNSDSFNSALDSGKYAAAVAADVQAGADAGVTGTPAMFINGRFVNGSVPIEQITAIVDDELRRIGP